MEKVDPDDRGQDVGDLRDRSLRASRLQGKRQKNKKKKSDHKKKHGTQQLGSKFLRSFALADDPSPYIQCMPFMRTTKTNK